MEAMSATSKCSGTPEREQYLPVDLLLEIVARSDITTVVRCTATTRILRRAILDSAFLGRFDPAGLLLGVSIYSEEERAHRVIHTSCSAKPRIILDASILGLGDPSFQFEPMASRDGLLLYRGYDRNLHVELLRVCDTSTGQVTPLPQITLSRLYWYVFRSVGDNGESYELLAMERCMRFQTFSSKHGQWGAVRQISITEHAGTHGEYRLGLTSPALVGRTVYWPCCRPNNNWLWQGIVAMDVDAAQGTMMEYPPGCLSVAALKEGTSVLFASMFGFLNVLVVEKGGISMWTFMSTGMWSRQLLIDKVVMEKELGLVDYSSMPIVLEGFGERSGSVIVRAGKADLLVLDLRTKVIKRLRDEGDVSIHAAFLHEIDLVCLLQSMKY